MSSEPWSDHGCLPAWDRSELPEPRPFSFRNLLNTIGPGAILLAGAIGGGEWILGPMMVVKHGSSILWICTISVFLQMIFNLEAVRYTMCTGEPILTGFMRLWPGPKFWGGFYSLMGIFQLATPAIAMGCGSVLFAMLFHRESSPDVTGDGATVKWITSAVIVATSIMLLSGKSIERLLERLSWAMISYIFIFLVLVNVLFVPASTWSKITLGFVAPQRLPEGMDIALLAAFAAMSGSGGLGNLVISNWFRDKGFGMGSKMGSIGGLLAEGHAELRPVGVVFPTDETNLSRWRTWWRYALFDQTALWAVGCLVGMFLNVNLAAALVPKSMTVADYSVGTFQAQRMSEQMWTGFWVLALLNGFWILYSTHLANTDCLVRTICDMGWAGSRRLQKGSASKIYAMLLVALTIWALIALQLGTVMGLLKILGIVSCPIMALAAFQILRVNWRFLPPPLRPSLLRSAALVAAGLFYGGLTVGILVTEIRSRAATPAKAESTLSAPASRV